LDPDPETQHLSFNYNFGLDEKALTKEINLQYIVSFCMDSGSRLIFIKTLDLLKAKNTVQKEYFIAALKMFCTFNEFFESPIRQGASLLEKFVAEYCFTAHLFVVTFTRRDSRNFLLLKDMKNKPVLRVHMTADWRCTYSGFGPNACSFQN
jgi:hypothetical protein